MPFSKKITANIATIQTGIIATIEKTATILVCNFVPAYSFLKFK